ncbi:uncharacterized protein [Littorina saxatilis]|uniref:CARD domain-containing protein n=1 Tax=Littorina saxatilis TaxID=31220 RepID=A0AAN9B802_9CAEN
MDDRESEAKQHEGAGCDTGVVYTNQEQYLRAIHMRLLELAEPRDSILMDELRANDVMGSGDEEGIKSQPTRWDRARGFYNYLHRVPLSLFENHCVPALETYYAHALEGASFQRDDRCHGPAPCVRHSIMRRLPLRRFADVFPSTNGCTHEEYLKITDNSNVDEMKWDFAFRLCVKNKGKEDFVKIVKKTLLSIHITVPEDFSSLLAKGFPCRCEHQAQKLKKKRSMGRRRRCETDSVQSPERKLADDQTGSTPQADCLPSSRGSAGHAVSKVTASSSSEYPPSTSSEDERQNSPSSDGTEHAMESDSREDTRFNSREDKMKFLNLIEGLNGAISSALAVKRQSLELQSIKVTLGVLTQRAISETTDADPDVGKVIRLRKEAKQLHKTMKTDYERASRVMEDMEERKSDGAWIRSGFKKDLQETRFTLINELNEAASCLRKSEAVITKMNNSLSSRSEVYRLKVIKIK